MRRWPWTPRAAAGLIALLVSFGALPSVLAPARAAEESAQARFEIETVAGGLVHPWGLAFLPNGDLLVTERAGRLRVVRDGQLRRAPVAGVPDVYARGQGGLLDVALHPDFERTRLIYLSFAARGRGGAGTEVARARLAPDARRLTGLEVILRAEPKTPGSAHYGSRLAFDTEGRLYITLGDRYSYMDEAQNLGSHLGSILRLDPDGSVPADNPFVDTPGAKPEIFSYGHRNVQGLARHPETGAIWSHEHGPRGGDEVNILEAGANYGWPEITYGIDYDGSIISDKTHAPGMKQPLVYWDPSIAPSGMAFYTGAAFPEWRGDLFVGALAHRHLRRLELDGDKVVGQEKLLTDLGARIRAVTTGPDGALYLLTDASDGRVLRLAPVGGGSG
jgi:glucose/arabinose dehydrogenase